MAVVDEGGDSVGSNIGKYVVLHCGKFPRGGYRIFDSLGLAFIKHNFPAETPFTGIEKEPPQDTG